MKSFVLDILYCLLDVRPILYDIVVFKSYNYKLLLSLTTDSNLVKLSEQISHSEHVKLWLASNHAAKLVLGQ